MHTVIYILASALCCSFLQTHTHAETLPRGPRSAAHQFVLTSQDDLLPSLEAELEQLRKDFRAPGMSVAIVHNGETILSKGFGVKNDMGEPVTENTVFSIASMTKVAFTSFGVASLVTEGKLSWNTPINQYRNVRFHDPVVTERATLLDLLSHRTGLPRHDPMAQIHKCGDAILDRLQHLELTRDLREKFQYSNLMYLLAGSIAGNTSTFGTWESLTQNTILNPLNMTSTTVHIPSVPHQPDYAEPYIVLPNGTAVRIPIEINNVMNSEAPAGGIGSNAVDLAKWAKMLLNRGVVDGRRMVGEKEFDMLMRPHMVLDEGRIFPQEESYTSYTLGWNIKHYRNHLTLSHGGNLIGYTSHICLHPDSALGIIILTNALISMLPETLCRVIADRIQLPHLPSPPWRDRWLAIQNSIWEILKRRREERERGRVKGTRPSHDNIEAYAGVYEHAAYGRIRVRVARDGHDRQPRLKIGDRKKKGNEGVNTETVSRHWHYDVFMFENVEYPPWAPKELVGGMLIAFDVDVVRGGVSALRHMDLEPALEGGVVFRKVGGLEVEGGANEAVVGPVELLFRDAKELVGGV
ncbi:hypothetical protein HK104_010403 [Borealophlyctis nickersoniae]|nr:hypothetical protein HK104_010403 [Borealophlyctis nickersoniae]